MARPSQVLRHAWNVFLNRDTESANQRYGGSYAGSYGSRPYVQRPYFSNERTIISAIYNRIAIDAAAIPIKHVRQDPETERYLSTVRSGLNRCLTERANIDQAATAFRQDIVLTMFDKGAVAIVPVDTTISPLETGGYDIQTLRVGYVTQWYPKHVTVSVFNEARQLREEVTVSKEIVAVIENPFYMVMNEPNSTLQRLIRKMNQLDAVDEASSSGKLDLIIQLPYVVKTDARREQANKRRGEIEDQLTGSKYGIAYTDGTEKITQLNRPVENNLMKQIEYLTSMLYDQLGVTPEILNQTASDAVMLAYTRRTVEPIVTAIIEGMKTSFLTKTARTQGHTVDMFPEPMKLVSLTNMGDIADKLSRNEILSSNEIRSILGFMPSKEPKADQLVNSNMPQPMTSNSPPVVLDEDTLSVIN